MADGVLLEQLLQGKQNQFNQNQDFLNPLQEGVLKSVLKVHKKQVEEAMQMGASGEQVLQDAGVSIATQQPTVGEGKQALAQLVGQQPPELAPRVRGQQPSELPGGDNKKNISGQIFPGVEFRTASPFDSGGQMFKEDGKVVITTPGFMARVTGQGQSGLSSYLSLMKLQGSGSTSKEKALGAIGRGETLPGLSEQETKKLGGFLVGEKKSQEPTDWEIWKQAEDEVKALLGGSGWIALKKEAREKYYPEILNRYQTLQRQLAPSRFAKEKVKEVKTKFPRPDFVAQKDWENATEEQQKELIQKLGK